MADINGMTTSKASLTAETEQNITFEGVKKVKLRLISDIGRVAWLVNDTITTITEGEYIDADTDYIIAEIIGHEQINNISLISDTPVDIQWSYI